MTGRRITTIVTVLHLVVVVAAWGIYRMADTPQQPDEAIQLSLRTLDTPAPDITEPVPVPPVQTPEPPAGRPPPAPEPPVEPPTAHAELPPAKPVPKSYNSAEEIRQRARLNKPVQPRSEPPPAEPAVDTDALHRQLLEELSELNAEPPDRQAVAVGISEQYLGRVRAQLYETWNEPHRTMVGDRPLRVTVALTIRADGSIATGRIVKRSNNDMMNQSVEACLRNLGDLPPIPAELRKAAIDINIVMQL
ncbi:MAG: TonB C-terminal domain-containing protein [Lentisphaeria bacterium]|jgi:TonB family protein|nr:TonB C-terminal domain-containing protein [Lentisphaeria bacterium]MDP7742303.1 TonB C-terminal domain-containing protein [Lentisphaeria bacterium]